MRVLVCGGRDYADRVRVESVLDNLRNGATVIDVLIHGACPTGVDRYAEHWASWRCIPTIAFLADWERHGKAAGPKRNQRMLDQGNPDLVIAFPGGRGTADMVRRARAAGVPVRVVE